MARLNETQLAALNLMIAKMTADKAEYAQISADWTDAIGDVLDAWADALNDAAEAYTNLFGEVIVSEDRASSLRTKLEGRTPPSLEELVALRSHYR